MYINYKLMFEKGILATELFTLIMINQKEAMYLKEIPFEYLEEQELITYIKGSGTKEERVRLSANGKALLTALTTRGISEESLQLAESLVELYSDYNKESGNLLEIRDRVSWFIDETGFSTKVIFNAVEDYVTNSGEYTMRLDNLFWKPQSTAYSTHYNLSDSRLFELIRKKYNLPVAFYLKPSEKRKVKDVWLYDVMKLKVPTKLPDSCYWTGSEKGDKEALVRLKKEFQKID